MKLNKLSLFLQNLKHHGLPDGKSRFRKKSERLFNFMRKTPIKSEKSEYICHPLKIKKRLTKKVMLIKKISVQVLISSNVLLVKG